MLYVAKNTRNFKPYPDLFQDFRWFSKFGLTGWIWIDFALLFNTRFRRKSQKIKKKWIWHFYNVFRSAKPIQIQPINPILEKNKVKTQTSKLVRNLYFLYFFCYFSCIFCYFWAREMRDVWPTHQLAAAPEPGARPWSIAKTSLIETQ